MNVLIISDIHIGDYPDYEYRRFQRLDNYPLYAKRICQIAKENGVQYLFILGDTTDQPTNRPYIQRRLKQVFSIFSNYFKKVFYILGQHDLDSRLFDYKSPDSTSIHLFAPDNFEYINRKIIQLGGRTIAAADFSDDQDLSWIIKPVDIFLGHVTINTSGFGQEIDYSKFTIGFAGDIHYPCSKNNLHSIGMSVQRYFSDAVDGTCVLLNLDDLSWKRILVDADRELFTRYLKVPDESQEGFSAELNSQGVPKEFRVYSPNTTEASEEIVTTVDSRATTINEVAEELCKANKISDVLGLVQSKYVDTGFVDLNFKLKKLYIENVRSIEKAEINFEKLGGVSFIQGNNGCFVGSTKVMTLDGSYETLENLYKSKATKIPVYSYDAEEGELEILYAERCQLTKYVDELVKITLDNGDSYECTLDHLWLTVNEGFKKAIDLKEGDALMPLHRDSNKYKKVYSLTQKNSEDNGFEYYNHKVVSVEVISKPNTPVYDLVNIPNSHDFAICDKDINSGVFVHNSGKSSAIWALNYALRGGLDIRDEVRIGQDFAMVYLILEYQGKEYAIYRGTDGVNFEINGQAQEFRNKRSTEVGIYEALPFINYLDSFFFMDDAVSILGSYSSERRIELLSVYYRLDIISKYYQIAEGLRGELYQSHQRLSATRDEELRKLEAILDQLDRCEKTVQKNGSININNLNSSIESLNKELRDSIAFEEEAKKFNESRVRNDLADAKRKLSTTLSRIKFAKEQIAIEVKTDLTDQSKILSSLDSDLDILKTEGQRLEGEISKLKIKLESLKQVTCPNCDSSFYVSGASILDKTALETSLKLTQEELESTYNEFKLKKDKFKEHKDLQKEYLDNQEKLAAIKSYKESLPALEETARMLESKIEDLEEQLKKFLENAAPVTSVSIQKKLDSLKSQLALIVSCEELAESIMDWKFSDNFEGKLKSLENQIVQLDKFLYLFSNNGEVYKRILQNIVKGFSSSEFEYSVVDSVYRGNTFTDITCNYKAPESKAYIEYARLSRGQKTLVDLDFIKNLVKGTGIIVFDEILKFLSPANQIKGNLIIKSMKAPLKLVTTQGDNFTYVDHVILAEYENNVTTFKLK